MFQFPGLALTCLWIQHGVTCLQHARLSHSEIRGSGLVCSSPRLIAAYHVLHRLLMPRHPPCALCNLRFEFRFSRSLAPGRGRARRITTTGRTPTAAIILLGDTFYNRYGNTQHVKEQPNPSLRQVRLGSCARNRTGLSASSADAPPGATRFHSVKTLSDVAVSQGRPSTTPGYRIRSSKLG